MTDADGNIAQHVEYIPYGEVFVEERNSQFSTNFLFNAKELDNETGLYYYGARYLDPTGAMWLSVDPVFHAGTSPYAYCLGNPVKMVDPDGRVECDENGTINVVFTAQEVNALILQRMNNPDVSDGAWMAYNSVLQYRDGEVDMNAIPQTTLDNGVVLRCGIARTDGQTPFLVLVAQNPGSFDDMSNCAGISILGGQMGTLTGDEADIVLRDEFTQIDVFAMRPNDVVSWGHKVRNPDRSFQIGSDGNVVVATDHLSRYLEPQKNKGSRNETERFIYKNGYSRATIASDNHGKPVSFDNAKSKASGGFENNPDKVVRHFRPNDNRRIPTNIHPLSPYKQ